MTRSGAAILLVLIALSADALNVAFYETELACTRRVNATEFQGDGCAWVGDAQYTEEDMTPREFWGTVQFVGIHLEQGQGDYNTTLHSFGAFGCQGSKRGLIVAKSNECLRLAKEDGDWGKGEWLYVWNT